MNELKLMNELQIFNNEEFGSIRTINDLQIFENEEFGSIRTITINNEPWFVGNLENFLTIVTSINDDAVERLMKEKNMSKEQAKQFLIDNCIVALSYKANCSNRR